MLMLEMNLANSQSANCSISSNNCVTPLTSNFTTDCNTGRLSNYAQCLSNERCLSSGTANTHLNTQYCGEGDCVVSCEGNVYHIAIYPYVKYYTCTYICTYMYVCVYL